jgi:acetylornithine deacetylase/succinyl-diaminopimelate desuccinylase-like protein
MLIRAGIPTICGFGFKGGCPHAANEWVSVDSLYQAVDIYVFVVQKYLHLD